MIVTKNVGTFLISLDFELLWGIRDFADQEKANGLLPTRQVVPRLLDLFQKYDIHATWATVGFLFFSSQLELLSALPEQKPQYLNKSLSPYESLIGELGEGEDDDPLHFAPSLIQQIVQTPHQELGTHTFSHYYCLEDGQTPKDFEDDLRAVKGAFKNFNCELKSIVFPRNQYSDPYLAVCTQSGVRAYRGTENLWFRQSSKRVEHRRWTRRILRIMDAYFNISGSNAYSLPDKGVLPINLPASRYLRPCSKKMSIFEPLRLRRIISSMTEAAQSKQVFHLWWHPEDFSKNTDANLEFAEKIFIRYRQLHDQYGMQSRSMGEIAEIVLSNGL